MKKKLFISLMVVSLMLVSAGVGAYAATKKMTLIVNGTVAKVDPISQNGVTYVPLRAAAEMLGASVGFDLKTNTVTVTSKSQLPVSKSAQTINGVSISLDKVVQDADSLRLYVTYTNNSKEETMTGDGLTKIVYGGKQYEYDHDFNFERYYETGVDKAPDFIEPGVSAKSVIYFKPVGNPKTINIVLKANFEAYKFNNITVTK